MAYYIKYLILLFFLPTLHAFALSYQWDLLDESDPPIKETFIHSSSLEKLKDTPLKSPSQLEWRAQDDLNHLKRIYQEKGYLSPLLSYEIIEKASLPYVQLRGKSGDLYTLRQVEVSDENRSYILQGKEKGQTATLERILNVEEQLLERLRTQGYPFALLENRTIEADRETHTVDLKFKVYLGPKAHFSDTVVEGNHGVDEAFIRQKIQWQEGSPYNEQAIEETMAALEATGLFTHISVRPQSTDCREVPMIIEVAEAKHRTISAGVGFTSQWGGGVNLEWEHRNIRGIGETLNFKTSVWNRLQSASILHLKPNVILEGQNLISKVEALREVTDGFTEMSWGISSVLERQLTTKTQVSYGLAFKQLHNTRSDNDRHFTLFKTPIKIFYNNTDNLLDPTVGNTALFKATPTVQILSPQFAYCITQLNVTQYLPLNDSITLAGKLSIGSIWGSSRKGIPPSERFYAGTESLLRGYRYMSVSPLNEKHKPIGGRSLLVGSIELRTKITESIGIVGFYEAGNVYSTPYPNLNDKILQSTGIGIRYHTPVGPLRFDVGIPLNPRKHVDQGYEIYFSIGQSF